MARITFLLLFFTAIFLFLLARLFYWQILKSPELRSKVSSQHQIGKVVKSERGEILSSDGRPMALNKEAYNVYANPQDEDCSQKVVIEKIASILEEDVNRLQNLLADKTL